MCVDAMSCASDRYDNTRFPTFTDPCFHSFSSFHRSASAPIIICCSLYFLERALSLLFFSDSLRRSLRTALSRTRGFRTFRRGGGGSYRNFRSGSKLLQGPGQINKQQKIADSRRGGFRSPKKKTCIRAWEGREGGR